jgi:hypothetical protein
MARLNLVAWGARRLCQRRAWRTIAGGYGNPFRVPISELVEKVREGMGAPGYETPP